MDLTFDEMAELQAAHEAPGAAEVVEELREVGLTEFTAGRLPLHPELAAIAAESEDPGTRWSGLAQPTVDGSRSAINKAKKAKKATGVQGPAALAIGESAIRREFVDDRVSPFERADYMRSQFTPLDLFTIDSLQVVWDKTGRFEKGKSINWKATKQVDEFALLTPGIPEATRQAVMERSERELVGAPRGWEPSSLATSVERLTELAATTTSLYELRKVAGNIVTPTNVLVEIYGLDDNFLDGALAANTSLPTSIAESMISHGSMSVRATLSCNIACLRSVLVELCTTLDDKHRPAAKRHLELLDARPGAAIDGMPIGGSTILAGGEAKHRSLIPRRKREATWAYQSNRVVKRLVIPLLSPQLGDEIDRSRRRGTGSAAQK